VSCDDGGTDLTYANFGQPFFSTYCTSCHGADLAEHGIDLSTEAGAAKYAAGIVQAAGDGAAMPPNGVGAPSAAERAQLVQYLGCGVP
jgi:uncharacterized membrane protein